MKTSTRRLTRATLLTLVATVVFAGTIASAAVTPTAAPASTPSAPAFDRVATVELTLTSGGRGGIVTLVGVGGGTGARVAATGLPAGAHAQARVHVGTRLTAIGASVAALPRVTADRNGHANGTGFVTANGHHVSVESVADGGHLLVVARSGKILAWGRIPPAGS